MKQILYAFFALIITFSPFATHVNAKTSRIKDIVNIEGVRDNQLIGYGLVVGLNGTKLDCHDGAFGRFDSRAKLKHTKRRRRDGHSHPTPVYKPRLTH
jgi:flagellar P-ring protein precursor FlgI